MHRVSNTTPWRRRSERVAELEKLDLETMARSRALAEESQLLVEATNAVVTEEVGKLLDTARADPAFDVPEENTGIRRLAEITGRSGAYPAASIIPQSGRDRVDTEPAPPPSLSFLYQSTQSKEEVARVGPITRRSFELIDTVARMERVIVVDDDPDVRAVLSGVLKEEGYGVRAAVHGIDALAKILIDKPPPDLILLDMGLPYLDGSGVIAALRTTPLWGIPIVLISGSSEESISPSLRRDHVFVPKGPHMRDQLLQTIADRVAEWRATPRE